MSGNATYPLVVGDIWEFLDRDRENRWTKYQIDEVTPTSLAITKLDGIKIGYRITYDPAKVKAPKWRWVSGTAVPDVLYPCPECEQDKPINEGDFICNDCRQALDSPTESE